MTYEEILQAKDCFKFLMSTMSHNFKNLQWEDISGVPAYTFKKYNGSGCIAPISKSTSLVTFKGSNDTLDFFMDAMILKAPYYADGVLVGRVHSGFLAAWSIIRDEAIKALVRLDPDKNITYILGGHSLGGALAVLFADHMIQMGYKVKVCYTAGCPRVGNKSFANWVGSRINVVRFVDNYDVVPLVPPNLLGMNVHMGKPAFIKGDTVTDSYSYRYKAWNYFKSGIKDHSLSSYVSRLESALREKPPL